MSEFCINLVGHRRCHSILDRLFAVQRSSIVISRYVNVFVLFLTFFLLFFNNNSNKKNSLW